MGTATGTEDGDEVVTDHQQDRADGDGPAEPGTGEKGPSVLDLTETAKPARRFYANLADL